MSRFVELKTEGGGLFWVNPDFVAAIGFLMNGAGTVVFGKTALRMHDGSNVALNESPADVVEKLEGK